MTTICKSFRFRFYPTPNQERQLAIEFGHARWVYNWALETRSKAYKERKESLNNVALSRLLTPMTKSEELVWLKDATRVCLTQKLIDLDCGFKNFFEKRAKYPRFKKKLHAQSVRYQLDQRNIAKTFREEFQLLKLPKLGALKLRWSRKIDGIPKMVTVSKDCAGRYFVSMSCDVEIQPFPQRTNAVGFDAGIKDVAVGSDGSKSGAPKHLRKNLRRLKLAGRRLSRKTKGSNRWHKQRVKVAKLHAHISDSRADFLHKLTTEIVRTSGIIVIEDLNVRGMMANRKLARAIADTGMHEWRRQLTYKSQWHNREQITINRWQRSTGVCPDTGTIGDKLPLSVREWRCDCCGTVHDRDIAAAQVICKIGVGDPKFKRVERDNHRAPQPIKAAA